MNIVLTVKDFPKELLSKCSMADSLVDILGWAAGAQNWDNIESVGFEAYDGAIDYVMDNFDFEEAVLKILNGKTGHEMQASFGAMIGATEWLKSDLLYGAWLKLNKPQVFEERVKDYETAQKDIVSDCLGGYEGREGINEELAKELDEAYNRTEEDALKEWLHGDYSNRFKGVERMLSEELGSEHEVEVDLDKKTCWNQATFTVEPNNVRETVEDYDGVVTGKDPGEKRIKAWLIDCIIGAASQKYEKEMAERKRRREEREKTKAYQDERKKSEEERERQRLLAMKR